MTLEPIRGISRIFPEFSIKKTREIFQPAPVPHYAMGTDDVGTKNPCIQMGMARRAFRSAESRDEKNQVRRFEFPIQMPFLCGYQ